MVSRDEDSIGPTGKTIITQFSRDVKPGPKSDKTVTQRMLRHLPLGATVRLPIVANRGPSYEDACRSTKSRMHTVPGLAALRYVDGRSCQAGGSSFENDRLLQSSYAHRV